MGTQLRLADTYYRLSDEEKKRGESSSIMNQREMVESYCRSHGIIIVREFVDAPDIIGLKQNPTKRASL